VGLPEISSYSEEQKQKVSQFSHSAAQYFQFLSKTPTGIADHIRLRRHRAWLECVCAEFFETALSEEICRHWSNTADNILNDVCRMFAGPHLALFAYGKLGSHELNLSSDIDLVFVSDSKFPVDATFLRKFQNLIQEFTDIGFCFRNDFDLRPGGRMGPLIPTDEQFQDYYGNYGETWERLAFVRLRPIWGDNFLIENVLKFTGKFTFRKHLDYTMLSDLQSLRQRIHAQYAHRTQDQQIDLKLGVGGIRDLELFVHALQVVHGGRDPELRQRNTSEALRSLEKKSILPAADILFLQNHYWTLRRWENLVQAEGDQQTHLLPRDFKLNPPFENLQNQMRQCDRMVSGLLGKVDRANRTVPEKLENQLQWLKGLGFEESVVQQVWPEIISTTVLSRQRERDENYRLRFLYLFLAEMVKYPQSQNRSLAMLRDFLKATRAKATFFSLFLNRENLIEQLARLFSTSPYLASLICSRPELIDSYVYRNQSQISLDDPQAFLDGLSEKKLLSELISGTDFLGSLDVKDLSVRMSNTADQIASDLMSLIKKETQCDLHLLALGKWGGREMGLRSDLDFIFITRDEPTEMHLKAARKFFHRLTESHHRGGSLYSIDMRLKPSGKGGLVVTSFHQLLAYLKDQAAAWERQAYLRSRFVGSDLNEKEIHQICLDRGLKAEDLKELEEIRKGLLKNSKTNDHTIDMKYGEGGLVDIELAAHTAVLMKMDIHSQQTPEQIRDLGWNELIPHYEFLRKIEQIHQTVVLSSGAIVDFQSESFESVAWLLRESRVDLERQLRSALDGSQHLLKRLDPRRTQA
jgi:[glutamine synthetase] adenylyltransferase / [glutamine synthetase]-adenylyl-L-tyrosine phosphorylase